MLEFMENQRDSNSPEDITAPNLTLSKRTKLVCLAISVIIYALIIFGIDKSGWFSPPRLPISIQEQLPTDYVDGKIDFSRGGRHSGNRIIVWPIDGGAVVRLECYGVDRKKYNNSLPCGEESFNNLRGKPGRIWYITRVNERGLFGPEVRKLAVQLLVYPDQLYPFSVQKEALLEAQARSNPIATILFMGAHLGGVLLVLMMLLPVAGWLQAGVKKPASAR